MWRGTMEIDGLIKLAEEFDMAEVVAVLMFTRNNGTDATIGLLAAADRCANAKGLLRILRAKAPLEKAVMRIRDGAGATGKKPWLALEDSWTRPMFHGR